MLVESDAAGELPVRVMALHALAYCERLYYLEEVEELRVADAAVFAGRALHVQIAGRGGSAARDPAARKQRPSACEGSSTRFADATGAGSSTNTKRDAPLATRVESQRRGRQTGSKSSRTQCFSKKRGRA